ncbi:MAG TPA: 2OG-Fe(II) oxygenase family protein [Acidothermaceae bacterium]|nr:2OG-Fe(II) oxygenase family protein [Acidothermaceae bacterium]
MPDIRVQYIAPELVRRGWATFRLDPGESQAFARLSETAKRFFRAPPQTLRLSEWPGHGMWAGYQPMPDGEAEIVDQVDRFEVSQAMLVSSDEEWPWLSAEARELKQVLSAANAIAQDLVAASVEGVAQVSGRDPDAARRLWCHDDASTLVVNNYRSVPVKNQSVAVKMKPHADFGGLTMVQVDTGLDALQFQASDGWQSVTSGSDDADLAVMLIGQLFAHWLGTEAPIHQVVQNPHQSRMSTVYFNQPSLDAVIVNKSGTSVVAGEHIAAMQDFYNKLGASPA